MFCEIATASVIQWPIAIGGNDHWYEVVYAGSAGVTWTSARDAAVARGGYLASITSAAENEFVYNLVPSDSKYWIPDGWGHVNGPWLGGYQYDKHAEPSGDWTWASGERFAYTNWYAEEPNNLDGHEDYVSFFGTSSLNGLKWNDQSNTPRMGIVSGCVVEYVPEPSSFVLLFIAAASLFTYAWRRRQAA
ncbi:MAG: lectin-like protein [Thermoguttaceae bacterium]